LPHTIKYLALKQLISESAANSDSNERILLYDIWKILEGEQREEVAVEDVRILLMTVVRIHEHKRIGVQSEVR
jgi:hypothetical protein